jgi:hypothetical protein
MSIIITAPAFDGDKAVLAKALVAAQQATDSIKKAASNPAFKSKYADLAEVVEGVVPALNANKVAVLQFPAFDGEMLHLTTTLLHESGASVSSTLQMRPSKTDPQGIGSVITYARRYSLLAMTGSAPEDDDANAASGPYERRPPQPAPARSVPAENPDPDPAALGHALAEIDKCADLSELSIVWNRNAPGWKQYFTTADLAKITKAKDARKAALTAAPVAEPTPFDDAIEALQAEAA